MPFVEIKDGRLYYESHGKGLPLVLIHGAWASHEWWRWQVPALSRHYRVLSLDVRGHGKSNPLNAASSVEDFTADLQVFLEKIETREVVLVGWSMGGLISIQYCLNYPSEVKALILIATRGHRNPFLKFHIIQQYLQARLSLFMAFSSTRQYHREPEKFPSETRDWLAMEVRRMLSPTAPKEVFDWVLADFTNNPRENYFRVARSIWNWRADNSLRNIKAPTLIMVGENDTLTPPRFSRLLNAAIPDSRLIIVGKASHYLALEQPERINGEIIEFLKGLGY